MSALELLLAHQGGWDEALFVLAPLLLFAGLLMVARKRVDDMESEDDRDAGGPADASAGTGDSDSDEERAGGR